MSGSSFQSVRKLVNQGEAARRQPTIRSYVVLMLVKKPSNLLFQLELTS